MVEVVSLSPVQVRMSPYKGVFGHLHFHPPVPIGVTFIINERTGGETELHPEKKKTVQLQYGTDQSLQSF
jgi:hypothetical protein